MVIDGTAAALTPLLDALAVTDAGIDVFALHQAQRLVVAEIVALATQADLADGLEGNALVVDLDTANCAHDVAQHVVVDDETF